MLDKSSFWSGFLGASLAVGIFCALGATSSQINNNFKNAQQVYADIANLYGTIQTKKFRVEVGTPTLGNLNEHEILILNSTSTKAIYTRLNSTLYNVKLSSS